MHSRASKRWHEILITNVINLFLVLENTIIYDVCTSFRPMNGMILKL